MELAALAVLGGAGYLLAQQTAPKAVYPTKSDRSNPIARASIKAKESFANMVVSGMASQSTGENARPVSNVKTSLRGNNPQLDIRYNDLMGRTPLPTEPDPSDQPSYLSGGRLSSGIPNSATSKLYASGTTLYWNGSAVGGAGGNPNSYVAGFGTSGWIPYYNSTSGIAISSGQSIYIGTVTAPLNTSRALIVRGAASQSANIFEAQNSSSGALLAITSSGAISGAMSPTILTSSGGLTLTDAHHGYIIEQTGVSASGTFTIGSPSIPGWNCMIVNIGSGVVISSGSNTMRSPGGLNKSRTQYSSISIYRRGTNDFVLGGDLA
jgi:hypothetical protein